MTNHETFATKKEMHEEIMQAERRLEGVVKNKTLALRGDILKSVSHNLDKRFKVSKEQRDLAHKELLKEIKIVSGTLEPIAKNYAAVSTMGRWVLVFLTFITILVTALANAKNGFVAGWNFFTNHLHQ